eukprot:463878-Amphidinium_carterae.1
MRAITITVLITICVDSDRRDAPTACRANFAKSNEENKDIGSDIGNRRRLVSSSSFLRLQSAPQYASNSGCMSSSCFPSALIEGSSVACGYLQYYGGSAIEGMKFANFIPQTDPDSLDRRSDSSPPLLRARTAVLFEALWAQCGVATATPNILEGHKATETDLLLAGPIQNPISRSAFCASMTYGSAPTRGLWRWLIH